MNTEKCIACGIEGQFFMDRKAVQIALNNLGSDVDEVYSILLSEKCYGIPTDKRSCPVATYLRKHGVLPDTAIVGPVRVDEESHHTLSSVSMPTPVINFIMRFDRGMFPELIKGFWRRLWFKVKILLGLVNL